MNFSDKSRYDRTFQQVTHKEVESAIKYIKIFQNTHTLSVLVGNNYTEYQLMHTFLDNFQQGRKIFSSYIKLPGRIEKRRKIIDQKSLNNSSLQIDYLSLVSRSGLGRKYERSHDFQTDCTFCGGINYSA